MKYSKRSVVKCKEQILPFYCCASRWALEAKWWMLGQRLPPLFLWPQQCPGPLRPVSLSTASFLTERSPVTQCTYPSTNTTTYFNLLFFKCILPYYYNRCNILLDMPVIVCVFAFRRYLWTGAVTKPIRVSRYRSLWLPLNPGPR